ncbi:heavy metal sensor histidine kinase [Acinetobacter sp. 187]|uniref:heavy metal sensor histidine kinase n=1 Tax=Acinetobacter lanii TaxID=2715163 RepID=UPI001407A8AE|nr:heavy metal sensor histidine kinase [Acinetobacter lanii]NHC02776.1 heavy metal sensor histidine kinase [Acinetobacter lanii]
MKRRIRLRLSHLLALTFGMISCVVFIGIGLLSDRNMQTMIQTQQDQALTARIERIEVFLKDSDSLELLIQHPRLYENMLGQQDNLLILRRNDQVIIEINPLNIQMPKLSFQPELKFQNNQTDQPSTRLASKQLNIQGQRYQLIAGKQLLEGQQTLTQYRQKLIGYSIFGVLLSTLTAWLAGHYLLRSIRQLIDASTQIDLNQHSSRFDIQSVSKEVNELTYAMNTMLTRIDSSYQQMARFSADIAHELRTPLNNLVGQTQIVLSHSRTQQDLENLLYSHLEEYERLNQMIESMLLIARLEHGEYSQDQQYIQLKPMLDELIEYFSFLAEEKQMGFKLDLEHGLEHGLKQRFSLQGHPILVERAVANLISNAIDYGHENSDIRIQVKAQLSKLMISVLTPQVRIEEVHLPHLFDRFYQIETSRHASGKSGGLGLAIVKSIMQLHQGEVGVENTPDGVVFHLIFPSSFW